MGKRNKEGKFDKDQKVQNQTASKRKWYVILYYILLNNVKVNNFLVYIREEDGCTRRGSKRGRRRGTRKRKKRKEKRKEKRKKRKKKDYQTKGMSLVALLRSGLSYFTDYSFTVYRWMKDGGCRRRHLRMIENLNRNLRVKKNEYEIKFASTIEPVLQTTRVI